MVIQATASVNNPYGITGVWNNGTIIDKFVMILLVLMSLSTWYVILTKWWDQQRLKKAARECEKSFWSAPSVKEGVDRLKKDNLFRSIAEDGMRAMSHHDGRLTDRIDLHEWITMSLQRSVEQAGGSMSRGLGLLATVGSSAPFVGLFGTVWGVMNALINIGLAGQASIGKVAGPVGSALIMTALGLAAAVPAVWGYNWLLGRNKMLQDALRNFASDLHAYLVSGARVPSSEAGGAKPAAAPAAAVRK
ncbi:MAG: MotA/TolQ/ExbB proton channel family protein [Steroidobacteraceae bacterium]